MKYLIIVILLCAGLVSKSQPYPNSSWPNPLPTSNLNAVQVIVWMLANGEITRDDVYAGGPGNYIRMPVSLTWLYNQSRLTATPIKLSYWQGYSIPAGRQAFTSSVASFGSQPAACALPLNQVYYYGSTGGAGDTVYKYATGDEKVTNVTCFLTTNEGSGNFVLLLHPSGVIQSIHLCE